VNGVERPGKPAGRAAPTAARPASFLVTDCGSTTTKAVLIERRDGVYRLAARGEAPTTVESPCEDVTVGVRAAVREIEETTGRALLSPDGVETPRRGGRGVDLYLSTSSAGGGLQLLAAGVIGSMSAHSAERAALGAGAIISGVLAVDDGRRPHERIELIRRLRPDMVLLAGGVDGGTVSHVAELAEQIAAAAPRPRVGGRDFRMPVIYAGNRDARPHVRRILEGRVDLRVVDNLRPVLEREALEPARAEIHRLFMDHVMARAPGYDRLLDWVGAPVLPTPGAVGLGIASAARSRGVSVLAVDIGGATTDVFSVFGGVFHRTVSANLGMSYSARNVLHEAGAAGIARWLPFAVDEADLRDAISNKMVRPTTIPATVEDLLVEQALAREALRLALRHHRSLAVDLQGGRRQQEVAGGLGARRPRRDSLVDLMDLGLLIGSGGILSHAPRRSQAALMLLDAFQPRGVTRLGVDSIFMLPQVGVLSTVDAEAAAQVFERDCLIPLGTAVAPVGTPRRGPSLRVRLGATEHVVHPGDLRVLPLPTGSSARAELLPAPGVDVGRGPGAPWRLEVSGGVVGLILDGRGRPLTLPAAGPVRCATLLRWLGAMDALAASALQRLGGRREGPAARGHPPSPVGTRNRPAPPLDLERAADGMCGSDPAVPGGQSAVPRGGHLAVRGGPAGVPGGPRR
jgi:uncharacterized protein (TIGR01319 family)